MPSRNLTKRRVFLKRETKIAEHHPWVLEKMVVVIPLQFRKPLRDEITVIRGLFAAVLAIESNWRVELGKIAARLEMSVDMIESIGDQLKAIYDDDLFAPPVKGLRRYVAMLCREAERKETLGES